MNNRTALIDAMCAGATNSEPEPPNQLSFGRSVLYHQYKPVIWSWMRRLAYWAGTLAMWRAGYASRIHPTEIGEYTVWTRTVSGSKPIVMFPGFGLGAVPYHRVMQHFGRTVHLVELPNLGFHTSTAAPGYMTSDTIYRVVRAHVGDGPHDLMAHSLGSSPVAQYVNHQHVCGTTPINQTAVICDGFVCPVDGIRSHIYPFVNRSMYREMMQNSETSVPWTEFSIFVWLVVHDLDVTIFTKRFHHAYDGILWREDYRTDIRYVFGERDLLYDVPYIRSTVQQSEVTEQEKYLFIPKARHGACLFGKRRNDTLNQIVDWFDSSPQ